MRILKITKYLILLSFAISTINCKAQSKTLPLFNVPSESKKNAYLKDIDNDYNVFIGKWQFNNGNEEITVEFKKFKKYYSSKYDDYTDYLIGEYKLIKNGNVLVNSLPSSLKGHPYYHNAIYSILIFDHGDRSLPKCDECSSKSRYVLLRIKDPLKPKLCGEIKMVHFIENGVRKIKMLILSEGACYAEVDDIVTDFNLSISDGEYIFTKVD